MKTVATPIHKNITTRLSWKETGINENKKETVSVMNNGKKNSFPNKIRMVDNRINFLLIIEMVESVNFTISSLDNKSVTSQ